MKRLVLVIAGACSLVVLVEQPRMAPMVAALWLLVLLEHPRGPRAGGGAA